MRKKQRDENIISANITGEAKGPPRLWRLPQVVAFTGLKKTQLYDAIARGMFPKPIRILETGRAIAWLEDEIVEHVRSRIAARDQLAQREPAE